MDWRKDGDLNRQRGEEKAVQGRNTAPTKIEHSTKQGRAQGLRCREEENEHNQEDSTGFPNECILWMYARKFRLQRISRKKPW